MKTGTIARLAVLIVLGVGMFGWAARISAADPAGDSPANGLPTASSMTETCMSQTLAPGAQVWLKVPYHAGTDLEMYAKNASGVNFDVYDPSQVVNYPTLSPQPIGRLTPNKNEPDYTKSWQGHLAQGAVSDFYYVLVTNTNSFPITFSFCTRETLKFVPPPNPCPPLATFNADNAVFPIAPERASSTVDTTSTFDENIGPITTTDENGCPILIFPPRPTQ